MRTIDRRAFITRAETVNSNAAQTFYERVCNSADLTLQLLPSGVYDLLSADLKCTSNAR